jgi:purine-nucleoside phosphorylase
MSGNPIGVVLGSGLGAFAETLSSRTETSYTDIAGWPASTAVGHAGKLVTGSIGSTDVIVLAGRAHLYEGYAPAQVVFGIRELARRGVKSVILTNASGGINLAYRPGDLVLISDHINLTGVNPLMGPNDDSLGPRFPDMSEIYTAEHREIAQQCAKAKGCHLDEGVYAGLLGPSYETPAEIRYLRAIGADLVGMSTILEATMASYLGMKVLGVSCVTNMAAGIASAAGAPSRLVHEEVLAAGEKARGNIVRLLTDIVPLLS